MLEVAQRAAQIAAASARSSWARKRSSAPASWLCWPAATSSSRTSPAWARPSSPSRWPRSIDCKFARVQFTPDLLPSDVTGVSVFNQKSGEFEFRPGPIFANIVLADEINRASPKTQSSLLECMEERQATIDSVTHPIDPPFMVIATQNPIEYEGTYPLPEAQLDRFMMRLSLGYPSRRGGGEHHPRADLARSAGRAAPGARRLRGAGHDPGRHPGAGGAGAAPLRGGPPDRHPRSSGRSTWAPAPGRASP